MVKSQNGEGGQNCPKLNGVWTHQYSHSKDQSHGDPKRGQGTGIKGGKCTGHQIQGQDQARQEPGKRAIVDPILVPGQWFTRGARWINQGLIHQQ